MHAALLPQLQIRMSHHLVEPDTPSSLLQGRQKACRRSAQLSLTSSGWATGTDTPATITGSAGAQGGPMLEVPQQPSQAPAQVPPGLLQSALQIRRDPSITSCLA